MMARTLLAVGLLLGAAPRTSTAAEKAEALIHRAVEARRAGDDEAALGLLREAYADGQTPHAVGQLGLCEHAVGLWADAEVHVLAALKAADRDPWVRKYRDVLERDLVVIRSHLARVDIQGEPVGGRVTIDGKDVGALPLAAPVRVTAGEVDIELSAPGFTVARRSIRVEAEQYEHVTLVATPLATAAAVDSAGRWPAAPLITARPENAWRPRAKWLAWGAGTLALAVGTYGALENLRLVHAFENTGCSVDDRDRAVDAQGVPSTTCDSKRSAYKSASHLAVGAFVAAGALGAAGLVLWLSQPKPRDGKAVTASCQPLIEASFVPGLGCALLF